MNQYNLTNKVAIITGASKGIGKEIALQLAKYGSNVMLVARDSNALKKTKDLISLNKGTAEIYSGDISNPLVFNNITKQTLDKWKKIDILINNAGITRDSLIMRMKEEDWDDVINTNLKGCFNGINSIAKHMIKNKNGSIINITSIIAQIGNSGQSNYAASKAGIIGLTKSIAKELGSRNIRVNAIAPGYIQTEMTSKLGENINNNMLSSIPLGKFGSPKDIAKFVCFLVSDDANYITGQTFNIDGGMVMQ